MMIVKLFFIKDYKICINSKKINIVKLEKNDKEYKLFIR